MKVNFISANAYPGGSGARGSLGSMRGSAESRAESRGLMMTAERNPERVCAARPGNEVKNNYDNINTSIKSNSDARVSFKGNMAQTAEPLAEKIKEPFFHYLADLVNKNPVAADAVVLIPLTLGAKPATLLLMGRNKKETEKKKYRYQAAKAIASGLAGIAMSFAIGHFLKKGVGAAKENGAFKMPEVMQKAYQGVINSGIQALNTVKEKLTGNPSAKGLQEEISRLTENSGRLNLDLFQNKFGKFDKKLAAGFISRLEDFSPEHSEIIRNAVEKQKAVNDYSSAAKNIADKMLQPIFLPLRAKVTYLTIPCFLSWVGLKKPCKAGKTEKPAELNIPETAAQRGNVFKGLNNDIFNDKNSKALFSPFLGGSR